VETQLAAVRLSEKQLTENPGAIEAEAGASSPILAGIGAGRQACPTTKPVTDHAVFGDALLILLGPDNSTESSE
jgi:hypothetical protein